MAGGPPDSSNEDATNASRDAVEPSGQSPASDRSSGSGGAMGQPELDALISSLEGVEAEEADEEGDTISLSPGGPAPESVSQSEMDDIIASIIGEQDEQSIEIRSAAPPGSGNQFEPGSAVPFSGPDAEPGEDALPHLIQQDELDALLSELQSRERARGVRDAEVPTKESTDSGANAEVAAGTEESPPEEASQGEGAALAQGAMDALVNQIADDAARGDVEEHDSADQGDMNTLLAQVDTTLSGEDDTFTEKAGEELKSVIEQHPPEHTVLPDMPPQPDDAAQVAESLMEEELDDVLAGEDGEQPLDARTLDTVIPEAPGGSSADMDAVLEGVSAVVPAARDETLDVPEIPGPAPVKQGFPDEDEMDAVISRLTGEAEDDGSGVGSENLAAAGTIQERDATGEAAQEAIDALLNRSRSAPVKGTAPGAQTVTAPAAEDGEDPGPTTHKRRKRPGLPHVSKSLLAKVGLSLAAGLIFGVASYVFLSSYQARVPRLDVPDVAATQDLEQLLARARALADTGDLAGAWRLLDGPLRAAPPSPLRTEAELLRIEAAYRTLPPGAGTFEIELVNSYLDSFLAHARDHEKAPLLLEWKATLYERAGIPFAAYNVYDQLLTGYGDLPNKPDLLFNAGRLALEVGRYNESAGYLRQLVNDYPGAARAAEGKLLLGETLVRMGRQHEGETLLRQVAEANTHTRLGAEACAALGRMAFDRGDYETAIALLNQRLQSGTTSEGNDQVLLMLAKGYRATNQMQKAQDALRDIVRFFPESSSAPAAYIELTEVLDLLGKRDDALRIAAEAAQEHPEDPDVLLRYSQVREQTGDTYGAAQALLAAEQAGAEDPQVLLTAGNQFLKAGYVREAEETFTRLVADFPGTPQAIAGNVALARIAFESNETGQALALLQDMARVAANTPQESEVLLALGDIYQDLGFQQQAADAYRAVAANSSEPEVLARAAMALYRAGAWPEGNEVSRRVEVERLAPSTAYAFLMEYGFAMLLADSARAVELLEQAHTGYAEQRTISQSGRLAEAYLALEQPEKAMALVQELVSELEVADVETFREIANACGDYAIDRKDYAMAAAAYKLAIDADAQETQSLQWAKYQLANALYAQGRFEECRPLYESVAASGAAWAGEAQLRLDYMGLRGRLSGTPPDQSGGQ